jgi:acetyl-CoA synthetase (ADP-forming)/acetyltransferase
MQASPANPLDLSAAATPEHFAAALEILRTDPETDAVLLLHVPTRIAPPLETAAAVAPTIKGMAKPVLTCWIGLETARAARAACDEADVSTFDSLEQAVDAFMHMAEYRRNQDLLDQNARSPAGLEIGEDDNRRIWALIGQARAEGKEQLTRSQSLTVIASAGIAVDRSSRSDADLALRPVQTVMGVTRDPVFGPLLYLGTGKDPASTLSQRRVGLPPLNLNQGRMLVDSTAIHIGPDSVSDDPESARESLAEVLVRLGQLIIEVPAIAEVKLVPLVAENGDALVASAEITLGPRRETAITPYPDELEETIRLSRSDRDVVLRPIRGEDAPAHAAFALRQSPESIRYRFFGPRSGFTQHELAQFTQIDYAREMAFIATSENSDGKPETLGVVRTWTDPDNISAEFAVIVDDSMRGEGLGHTLLTKIIDYTRQRGTLEIRGTVLSDNKPMRNLAKKLGFSSRYSPGEQAHIVSLLLNEPTDDWQRQRLGIGSE